MSDTAVAGRKRVLLVEDDQQILRQLRTLFDRYSEHMELFEALDAGAALRRLAGPRIDALVLDIMMPYGDAREQLGASDPLEMETGINLLEHVRKLHPDLWVAVITARSGLAVGRRVRELLGTRGKLYHKPFSTLQLEDQLVRQIGLTSQVSAELLPSTSPDAAGPRP